MSSDQYGTILLCVVCLVPFLAGVLITRAWYRGQLVPGFIRRWFERIKYED